MSSINSKELRNLVKKLQSYDWIECVQTRSNHFKVYRLHADGSREFLATLPMSPSSYRSYRNTLAQLKRAGVPV